MTTWTEFEAAAPEIAARGRELLTAFGLGLGYLATVRRDGGPRIHPFCPVFYERGLYGLIGPSPKQADLLRDGRYAIHSFPLEDRDDEFYITGTAARHDELAETVRVAFLSQAGKPTSSGDETCFEFHIEGALLAEYRSRSEGHSGPPVYRKWREDGGA